MVADAGALAAGATLAFKLQLVLRPVPGAIVVEQVAVVLVAAPFFAIGAGLNRLYQARANDRRHHEVGNLVKTVAVLIGGLLLALRSL